jgi:FkbM family methyltransferase
VIADRPLVMDLGMHDGRDTRAYLDLGYRVVAVEANPLRVAEARQTFAREIASGALVIEAVGLSHEEGEQPFYRNVANDKLSSFNPACAGRGGAMCEVMPIACLDPGFLFDRYGVPEYLKVDLEGADGVVLEAVAQRRILPRFCSIELTHVENVAHMERLGYREFQLVNQAALPTKGNPSGPFGEQLPAVWVDAETVALQYGTARTRFPNAWFDLHARSAA